MNNTCEYTLVENISLTEVDNELVLLNLATGAYYGLNHIGADLIKAIQKDQAIAYVIRQIAERYQMDYPTVDADIEQLISQLLDQKLLRKSA